MTAHFTPLSLTQLVAIFNSTLDQNPVAPCSPPAKLGFASSLDHLTAPEPSGLTLCASADEAQPATPSHPLDDQNEFARYRWLTTRLLRRYLRQSIQIGRLPNILGREILPARASHMLLHTFEDQVIFTHDMERCLDRLPADSREIISVIVMQDFSFDEAIVRFGWSRRILFYALPRALDETTELLLRYGLM
jgi:hypothetical protein